MQTCNSTLEDEYIVEDPIWHDGWTFHKLGLWVSAAFGIFSVLVALLLVYCHATHYSKPWEQKHIIRILLMIPIYSTVSFLSYLYYRHAVYFEVLRDCYEAFAIASFFALLCNYIAPTLHEQKEFFRSLKPINWFWGVFGMQYLTGGKNKGLLRIPRSGLTWFNVIWISIFQYCIIRIVFTIVSVVTQYFDLYCEASLSPAFAHVWVEAFEAASVAIAMFCLVQFYLQLRGELAPHKPFLKVLCIKLVIFFSFWQTLIISFLSSSRGPLQPTKNLAYPDIKIGIPSVMLCIEMAIFSIMHIFAFPWQPYRLERLQSSKGGYNGPYSASESGEDADLQIPTRYKGGPLGIFAIADAFNPWDIIKASARGLRWLFIGHRRRFEDSSYSNALHKADHPVTATGAIGESAAAAAGPQIPMYSQVPHNDHAHKVDTADHLESDQTGLLSHSGQRPLASPPLSERDDLEADLASRPPMGYLPPPGPQYHRSVPQSGPVGMPSASQFGGQDPILPSHDFQTDTSYHGAADPPIGIAIGGDEPPPTWADRNQRPVTPQSEAKKVEREKRRREEFEKQQRATSRPRNSGGGRERSRSRPRSSGRERSRSRAGRDGERGWQEEERGPLPGLEQSQYQQGQVAPQEMKKPNMDREEVLRQVRARIALREDEEQRQAERDGAGYGYGYGR